MTLHDAIAAWDAHIARYGWGVRFEVNGVELASLIHSWRERTAALAAERAKVERLERENFALAANQCHAGYGDDYGNHRCREIDALRETRCPRRRAGESQDGGRMIYWIGFAIIA